MNATKTCYRCGPALLLLAALALVPACARRAPVVPPGEEEKAPPAKDKDKQPPEAHSGPVAFGATGCPIAVLGPKVWGLKDNKALRQLDGADDLRGLRALSASGRWFAAATKSANQVDTGVTVWSTRTGKKALDVPGQKDAYADLIMFVGDKYLVLGGRHNKQLELWDVENKEKAKTVPVPAQRVDPGRIAFSPDGGSFACVAHDKIAVHDLNTGGETAVMALPKGTEAIFICAWTNGLAFSPDGKELAAYTTHPQPRLLCWSAEGQRAMDEPVPMARSVAKNKLEWLPDRSGWLIDGNLFDRASKRVLLSARVPFGSHVLPHVLDKDHLAGLFGPGPQLQTVAIPWARLTSSLRKMNDKAPAFLTPFAPISVEVDTTGARGDVAATRKALTDALARRLARDGIKVADKQRTVLRLRLEEQAGETLPIYERQSAFDFRGKNTGRKATEAKGAAIVELVARGQESALWRGYLTASSSRTFSEEINDVTIRKTMLEGLSRQLNHLDLPYFIPRSREDVALPAILE